MKIKRKTFVGGILAALCACTALTFGTVFSFSGAGNNAYADSANGSASVLSIDTKTGTANTNFENKIEGGQKEYVYFGSDFTLTATGAGGYDPTATGTPMKWRVLKKNDTKYGSGKNLLMQSELHYNIYYNSAPTTETVFWGSSCARAILNGTTTTNGEDIKYYVSTNGNLSAFTGHSVIDRIAITGDSNFKNAIQGTKPYITRLIYWPDSALRMTATAFTANYQFITANASATRSTDPDVTGGNNYVVGDKVSGDRLFYLDIEDVANTADYGFVDSVTNKTYFELIAANNPAYAFTGWQNGYPTFITANGILNDALKNQSDQFTTLREPFINDKGAVAVMTIYGKHVNSDYNCGNIIGGYYQYNMGNARPATVLDLSQIAYASSYGSNVSNTLTDVTGTATAKPEYKLYIKDSGFSNTGFAPVITSASSKVKVTFKNTSGKAGNLVLLLQDKNATDGSVAYQAVSAMTSGTSEQVVEFNLPSSVAYKDYIPTVMLTSANTTPANAMATESVYATYTQNGVIIPKDIDGMEYNSAHSHWLDNLNLKAVGGVTPKDPVWIDKSMHLDTTVVTVKSIKYKSFVDGATEEDKTTAGTSNIINAGEYTITLELADKTKYQWTDGTTTDKPFKITVDRIKPNVTIGYVNGTPATRYVTDNGGKLPDIQNVHANATPGTLQWHESQDPSTTNADYYWKFEPDTANKVNYLTLTEKNSDTKVNLVFRNATVSGLDITINKVKDNTGNDTAVDESIYDAFTLTDGDYSLKNVITVKVVYNDNDGTKKEIGDDKYTLSVVSGGSGGKLAAGNVTIRARSTTPSASGDKQITVLAASVVDIDAAYDDNGTHLVYPVTESDIKGNLTVTAKWNYSGSSYLPVSSSDSGVTITGNLEAGDPITLTVNYKGKTFDIYPTIDKGVLDMTGVSLTTSTSGVTGSNGAYTFTYDPAVTVVFATSGDVKNEDGDTVAATPTITYKKKNSSNAWVAATAADLQNAGEYKIIATYAPDDTTNYEIASGDEEISVTLEIKKANYPGADKIEFKKQTITHDGQMHSLVADKVPAGVTVTYVYNGSAPQTTPFEFNQINETGYTVTAKFAHTDANYNDIDDITALLIITDKETYTNNLTIEVTGVEGENGAYTATYDPDSAISFTLGGKLLDKDGAEVTFTPTYKYEKEENGEWVIKTAADLKNAGKYRVTISVATGDPTYADVDDLQATLTIKKATLNVPDGTVTGGTAVSNGQPHKVEVASLPEGVKAVKYEYNGVKQDTPFEFTDPDNYTVKVHFVLEDDENYNDIDPVEVTLTISDAVVTGVSAKVEDGAAFTTASTLDELKAKLTAEIEYNNGNKESVEVADLEITCDNLRDGDKFKAGKQVITVKYADGVTTTVEINVAKVKVALPTFKGGLSYTGAAIRPNADNFNGYDAELMTFVADKLQSGLTVGTYKAVFALNDYDNYEWATATTYKKAVFAVALYDGEVTLLANEAAVDWNVGRAVITATKKDGALPVFASESFMGELSDVITLKYYTDETCTEEIAAEDLAYETTYYVKAELLDTENFELDASAEQYRMKSFTYTTPAKELTVWDKVVKFLVKNWLWLVIAAVVLISLILIIVLGARSAKRKRERRELEEQRRLEREERKEEERRLREEERRREEREERMARMAQPQMMMPQMMPQMPQQSMAPAQSAPQAQAAGGGSISPELLAIITGMNGKIEKLQSDIAANELASTREELAQTRNELMVERMRSGNMPGDTLTEALTVALKNVLSSAAPQIIAAAPAQPAQITDGSAAAPAATQVPPDAVMTTVTTTKIDTTKKSAQPAQNAQAAPAGRTVVRNYVAPMPVDDGRVFDVGGFYTPADPVTDLGFTDDDKHE
ncbi:MAG: hypothetical protein K2O44_06345 [Clostridia bacterium]|nr:hypothetical protein [Clostridia bacterium]